MKSADYFCSKPDDRQAHKHHRLHNFSNFVDGTDKWVLPCSQTVHRAEVRVSPLQVSISRNRFRTKESAVKDEGSNSLIKVSVISLRCSASDSAVRRHGCRLNGTLSSRLNNTNNYVIDN